MRPLCPHTTTLWESLLTCLHSSVAAFLCDSWFVTTSNHHQARPVARSQGRLQCQLPQVLFLCPKCLFLTNLSSVALTVALPTTTTCHDWHRITTRVEDWVLLTALVTSCWLSVRHDIEQWLPYAFCSPLWDMSSYPTAIPQFVCVDRKLPSVELKNPQPA